MADEKNSVVNIKIPVEFSEIGMKHFSLGDTLSLFGFWKEPSSWPFDLAN